MNFSVSLRPFQIDPQPVAHLYPGGSHLSPGQGILVCPILYDAQGLVPPHHCHSLPPRLLHPIILFMSFVGE